jgi:hypothetical protein
MFSQGQQTEVHVSGRPTIIEVWQKRAKVIIIKY